MPFTKETAAENGRKSHAAGSARFLPKPEKIPALNADKISMESMLHDAEMFRRETTVRARGQFRRLQDKIDALLDCRDLDVKAMRDLADASLKLESIEQKLSGRAGPGTLKPTNRPQRAQTSSLDSPEPASSVVHTPSNSVPIQAEVGQDTQVAQPIEPKPDTPLPPVV